MKVKALSTFSGIATHVKISFIRKKINSPGAIIMRLSKEQKENNILELYRSGHTYSYLQKRYRISSRDISRIVKGVQVGCFFCGKPKGKTRFHAHHPDRVNQPDHTIPACPSCHAREEARLRREKENQPRPLLCLPPPATGDIASKPINTSLSAPLGPLSPRGEKVLKGIGVGLVIEVLFPGFFDRRWQEIQDHWRKS